MAELREGGNRPTAGRSTKYRIAWLPGDGIGVDVLEAAKIVLDTAVIGLGPRESEQLGSIQLGEEKAVVMIRVELLIEGAHAAEHLRRPLIDGETSVFG